MKSRFLNIISIALVATLSLETTGCNVAGSRAAAVTAGVLLGVGVGAQAATHSSVEVKIDVYEPSDADDPLFKLNHALAVRQVIDTGPKQASPAKLLAADKELQPKMNRLKGNLDIIGETVSALQNKNAPLAAVAGDMKAIQEYETEALKAWSQFEDQLADASADGFPKAEVQDVADKLNVLRKSLRKISAMRLQPESVAYIQLLLKLDIIRASHLDKNGSDYANKVTDIQAALKNAWDKLPEDSTATTENQIIRTLDAARGAVADNPDAAAFIDSLKKNLDSTADPKTLQNGDAGSGGVASFVAFLGAVKDSKDVSETAITITIDALTAGINLGPISNDVMQFVVGQRRLLSLITRDNEDNEGRWHCFTRCFSRGGTGNNDTVFYMENMALPVLKSATFDPSKFLAADGSIYKQALASLGAAAQQKTTGASSGTTPASATGNKAAKATPKSKPGGAAGAGGNGGKVASAPSSNIEGRRDSSDRANQVSLHALNERDGFSPTLSFAVLDAARPTSTPAPTPSAGSAPSAPANQGSTPSPAAPADGSNNPPSPSTASAPSGDGSASTSADADATKIANLEIAAVRNAKLDALRQILDQQQNIKSTQPDQGKWTDGAQKPAIQAVANALNAASADLRAASKAGQ